MWTEEGDEEEKKKERRRKDHVKLVEARVEVQGREDPQLARQHQRNSHTTKNILYIFFIET